jgi:CDP-glucose 4,6-dehydratase
VNLSFYRNKRVFVTGHTGFKGSWLCRALMLAGADVTGYSLAPCTTPSLFRLAGLGKKMRSITADVRDLKTLSKSVKSSKPEIVFHMAAQPLVRESYKDPVCTYETNVMGTVNLLEACRNVPAVRSVVNVTTDKVYEVRHKGRAFREDEPLNGYDPYSNSKSCSELVTSSYRNSFFGSADSPSVSTARSGNVIGGGDFAKDRLIPDCVRALQKGAAMRLRNPGAIRPFQYVLDCLCGYLTLAQKQYDRKLSGSYNFGPDKDGLINNAALVEMYIETWGGGKFEHKHDGGPHETHFLRLDCAKAKTALGWKPRVKIEKAVALTAVWYREFLNKGDFNGCMDAQINDYFRKG